MQHWVQPMQIGFPNVATMLSNNCVKQCDKILLPMLQNTTLGEIPNVAHTLPMLPKNTTKIGDTIVATHLKGASPLLHPNVACNIGKKHATMGTFVPCVLDALLARHITTYVKQFS